MRVSPREIPGVLVIETDRHSDERGSFERIFCSRSFAAAGLPTTFVQCNLSANRRAGTIRGLHFQNYPSEEGKLVSCTRGAVYDVVVDLRKESPTYRKWMGLELRAEIPLSIFIPPGLAHGFQTLDGDSDLLYHMTKFYDAPAARGIRWNDSAFGITWPIEATVISERDRTFPDFT